LKTALADATLLAYPDHELPMEIHPDACGYRVGAALLQTVEGCKKPLAFASLLMKKAERNYSITEQECLAVVWALK